MGLNGAEITGFNSGTMESIFDGSTRLDSLGFWRHDVMAVAAAAAGKLPTQGRICRGVYLSHHR
tara:strand:- start:132 stop:323 length:192 start_codon:yes stop_codon:yes gene_type:complete